MLSNMQGDLTENVLEQATLEGARANLPAWFKRVMKMRYSERLRHIQGLPKWKKAILAAAAPGLMSVVPVPVPMRGDDVELMGGKFTDMIKRLKAMSPAQRKAEWNKLPWWKKAGLIAAAPALFAVATASLPVLLPTAAAVGTTAASLKLSQIATKKLIQKVQQVRAQVAAGRVKAAAAAAAPDALRVTEKDALQAATVSDVHTLSAAPWPLRAFI